MAFDDMTRKTVGVIVIIDCEKIRVFIECKTAFIDCSVWVKLIVKYVLLSQTKCRLRDRSSEWYNYFEFTSTEASKLKITRFQCKPIEKCVHWKRWFVFDRMQWLQAFIDWLREHNNTFYGSLCSKIRLFGGKTYSFDHFWHSFT